MVNRSARRMRPVRVLSNCRGGVGLLEMSQIPGRPGPVALRAAVAVALALAAWCGVALAADTELRAVHGANAGSGLVTTLEVALIQAYQNNPQLNAQRAATRVIDENVAIALSGYRPRVSGTASLTEHYLDNVSRGDAGTVRQSGTTTVTNLGVTGTQTLFNGFQTGNRTRQAESQVFAARENLRATEQNILLNAVIAYMNLLRDAAILELQRSNIRVLEATLRQTRDRFNVGEVTRTDVAQSESRLAAGRSSMLNAESNFTTSRATFRQVIGVDPGRLTAAMPVDRFSPRTLDGALARARTEHPSITTAMYNVDVATHQVKIAEGALYPTLALQGNVQKSFNTPNTLANTESFNASVGTQLSVPIYQGGARIRRHPSGKGNARTTAARSRYRARAGAGDGRAGLGPAGGGKSADRGHAGAGQRHRDRAQRRP